MNDEDQATPPPNLVDLIEQLQQPPEPPPVSMMPQTWGWAGLAMLLAIFLVWLVWRLWRHRQSNAYRRAALAELDRAGDDPAAIARLLRRTALAVWPRESVASLTGEAWLDFLSRTGGDAFAGEAGQILLRAPWRREARRSPELRHAAAHWIRHHRAEAGQ